MIVEQVHEYTVLTCRAHVPRRRDRIRYHGRLPPAPHGARLCILPGRWKPTGRVIRGPEGRYAVPRDRFHLWAWCQTCKAATEYEWRGDASEVGRTS